MKRSYVIYILLLISLIFTILIWQKDIISASFNSKIKLDEVSLLNEVSNGTSFAMYYETQQDDGTYTYVESEDTTWPIDLRYNAKKSGCVDYNGNEIDGTLTYNKETNKVTLRTKSATLCYLYFDLGTEEKPYRIQYIEDLVNLSNNVNNGEAYEDAYFTLEKNLDFKQEESYRQYDRTDYGDINGIDETTTLMDELTNPNGTGFPPIGNGKTNNVFKGNFNGLHHKLENLYVHNYSDTSKRYGLFGYIYGSTIKDFELTGSVITEVAREIGGLTSYAKRSTFKNIITRVTVTSKAGSLSIGGLIGAIGEEEGSINKIINCINYGDISNSNNTGGLVGYLDSKASLIIEESSNYGTITNNIGSHAGGLIGRDNAATSNTTISKSHNYGQIKIEKNEATNETYVGGLMGKVNGTLTIEESSNEIKTVNDEAGINVIYYGKEIMVGGIVGHEGQEKKIINNSYNTSNIKIESETKDGSGINIGGILGLQGTAGTIGILTNNYNTGKIEVTAIGTNTTRVGGIVGFKVNGELSIDTNYNEGIIHVNTNAVTFVGGIIAATQTILTMITNSHNTGEINSKNTENYSTVVGGIIGKIWNSTETTKVENSYNTGNINGGTRIGGIIGSSTNNSKVLINKCYNTGNLTSQEDTKFTGNVNMGGIISEVYSNSTSNILNSYNTGMLISKAINTGNYVSGIASVNDSANISTSIIINSYNLGSLISKNNVSGIVEAANTSNSKINNVYNAGNVEVTRIYSIIKSNLTGTVDVKNAYYLSGVEGSNVSSNGSNLSIDTKSMSEIEIKSQTFVDTLNSNINNIDLESIDPDLKDYTLVDWVIDSSTGYPTLNFKLEGND